MIKFQQKLFKDAVLCLLLAVYCLSLFPVSSRAQNKVTTDSPGSTTVLGLSHLLHDDLPVISGYSWGNDPYKDMDIIHDHSCYNLLAPHNMRRLLSYTDMNVHNQVKQIVEYAKKLGIAIAPDLDPRVARQQFADLYPDELQESLWLREVPLSKDDPVEAVVRSIKLGDHMTREGYISLQGSLLRVYAYHKTADSLIDATTLKDITQNCIVKIASKDSVVVSLPAGKDNQQACVMVSFTRQVPAIFAPHLMEFQDQIIRDFSDLPLGGGMRDEWGFPPSWPIKKTKGLGHFWYSKYYAKAYAEQTGGRELLSDCLLMYVGIKGRKGERQMAINNYMKLDYQRNTAIEDNFYHTIKETFGPTAAVVVHPTWWPYPNRFEYRKNGLDWWAVRRDLAQTDEIAPFAVRTALSKKWGSPVWYNQYYKRLGSFQEELWGDVLGGGRVDFLGGNELLQGNLMRGESRVRLLDFISRSPLNCPVAVVFGHAAVMNWAGPYFEDVGMKLVDSLWSKGVPTDLIPTTEIRNNSLRIDKEGWIRYGKQRYAAVILYSPEFEDSSTAAFFNRAAKGQTSLFRIGNWTRDFNGHPFDGNTALPQTMVVSNIQSVLLEVPQILKRQGILLQTPATRVLEGFSQGSNAPPAKGFCRLIDGTLIQVAGANDVAGDMIDTKMKIGKYDVAFNAVGVAAVRLDKAGKVQALAAGGLKFFKTGDFVIQLDKGVDLALWRNDNGKFEGVIQGLEGSIPPPLLAITKAWTRLSVPVPLSSE